MKLNKARVHWIIRQKKKGVPTKEIAQAMKITSRRVQQVWRAYPKTGREPVLGENIHYRFGARMLEVVIRKRYKVRISHNRIHMYLKAMDLAHENEKKQSRRKWVRYERKHK
ncbi:Uncharacterised protein [uncultured archaeon]|nr:Uncharacterised protein [uncultured archaeon]